MNNKEINMSTALQIIVILSALALLIVLSYKNLGYVVAPVICAALISLVSESGFSNAFFVLFPQGCANFVKNMLLPVMSGSVLGEIMSASGAGDGIGKFVTEKLGSNNAHYAIMATSFIVALSGMSSSMFLMSALSHVVMKQANLPSYVGLVSFLSIKEIAAFALPGLPHANNLLPTSYLGTDLYAGALPGIVSFAFGLIVSLIYVRALVKKARAENLGYEGFFINSEMPKDDIPSFFLSVLPLILIISVTFILQKGFGLKSSIAAFFTQLIAIFMMIVLLKKHFRIKVTEAVVAGVKRGGDFLLSALCLAGFASVMSDTKVFGNVLEWINSFALNPYLFTFLAVCLIAALTCDATSALLMFMQTFSPAFTAMNNVNLGYIHRIAVLTSTGFDSLPQGSACLMVLRLFGYDHKSGYKYLCMASLVIPALSGFVCTVISMILG